MNGRSKICTVSGCPEIVENSNGMCPEHRQKQRKAADRRVGRVRGSRWRQARARVLRENPFCACTGCAFCENFRNHHAAATEIDHVTPLREGGHPTSLSNLQGLCHECHLEKTKIEQSRIWE